MSEWADRYRVLSPEASSEPGQWNTGRAEYQRGILDAASDPAVETVVVMSSAQVGKTEITLNLVGFHIHQDPSPILVVQPTVEIGEAWSKDRLAPMIRDCEALRGKVRDAKSRDSGNTLRHKVFSGGHLTIAGANSAASLASRPIRVLIADEVDRFPSSAGTEGDPVSLGRKRTTTFWNRRVILVSTPTTAGASRIEMAYQESDQRRFWVPCAHCGEMQTLKWERVRWTNGDAATALMHCSACGAGWSDAERWAAVRCGEWRAEAPFKGIAGFHLSELYSPWRRLSETVSDFLAAKDRPEMLRAWKNLALGEPWQERGDAPDWQRLIERREPFTMGVVPPAAVVLTAGVDNQNDRLELSVWAWAQGYESWLIDTRVFLGNPGDPAVWDELDEVLEKPWPIEGGGSLKIMRVGIDTGGSYTSAVYSQIRRLRNQKIVPLKGVDGWNKSAPVSGPTLVDVTENGRKLTRGLRLWTVAVSTFKADLYRRLWITRGDGVGFPPGWVHLPSALDPEHVKQIVAEEMVTVRSQRGFARMEWKKLRDRNEQLDMAVYARAALSVMGSDRYGERFWDRFERPAHPSQAHSAAAIQPPSVAVSQTGRPVVPARRGLTSRLAGA